MIIRILYIQEKKAHSLKVLVVATLTKKIKYVGLLWNGKTHDINIFKKELSGFDFRKKRVHLDLGFHGLMAEEINAIICRPNKKPKGGQLSDFRKAENKILSKIRIVVENALAGVKSFFICRNRNRFHYYQKTHEAFIIAVGLHNFKLDRIC